MPELVPNEPTYPIHRKKASEINPQNFDEVRGEKCLYCDAVINSFIKWQSHMARFHVDQYVNENMPKYIFSAIEKPVWRKDDEEEIPSSEEKGKFKFH